MPVEPPPGMVVEPKKDEPVEPPHKVERKLSIPEERKIIPALVEEAVKRKLQPRTLGEFIGQRRIKESLAVSIEAAKTRGEALGHILLRGPEGCGKETLAQVIANEMNVNIKIFSGPAIGRAGDLAAILTNLRKGDILFIDEVHRLRRAVEETLYAAMEDFALDIIVGKGSSARGLRLRLPGFTVIGATDQPQRVSRRLRQRFEHIHDFDPYDEEALKRLVLHRAEVLGIKIDEETSWLIGRGAEGNIREAERLLDRVRDYAQVRADGVITQEVAREALTTLGIDAVGWAVERTVPSSGEREVEPTSLTWQDFEDFVAKLFEALGYQNVKLTPRVRDEGKDIVMEWADPLHGSRMIYVECKHWEANSVGRREVQVLHSAVIAKPEVNQGVIVTTGRFTDGAIAYAKQVGVIELIDGEKLQGLIAKARIQEDTDRAGLVPTDRARTSTLD
jgi:Holliday junction DNA helicase RuvB